MKKHEYDAILEDWGPLRSGDSTVLRGEVRGDDKGRFKDGDFIRTSAVLDGWLHEGNIIQTRNTRYLLGKRHGTQFDDGHTVESTADIQIASLRGYMDARGYNMVYTDSSVFFRLKDLKARTPNNQVSFRTAVVWHNKALGFTWSKGGSSWVYINKPEEMVSFRPVKKVKLQVTGNRIIVQSHKIEHVQPKFPPVVMDIHALVDSL